LVTAVAPGTAKITAESENKIGMATITVTAIPVASVSVSLASGTVIAGQTTQATAITLDGSGNTLTGRVIVWSSDDLSVATVSSTGLVTSHAAGVAHITAASETKTGTAALTVDPVPVATVAVNPSTASVIVGATQQLTATTKDINDNTLSGRVVTWSSSDPTRAIVSSTGLVTAVAVGPAVITATSEGKTGTSSITVIPVPVASVTVSLTPNSITAVGTSQAAAVTLDANGAVLAGRAISWSSSNTAVATVSAQGVVTAVAEGTANIIAISEGKTGSAVLAVTSAPVATVIVSPPSATVFQSATEQLTVVLEDAHNNVLSGRAVVWSSSAPAIATVSTNGLVTAASGRPFSEHHKRRTEHPGQRNAPRRVQQRADRPHRHLDFGQHSGCNRIEWRSGHGTRCGYCSYFRRERRPERERYADGHSDTSRFSQRVSGRLSDPNRPDDAGDCNNPRRQ